MFRLSPVSRGSSRSVSVRERERERERERVCMCMCVSDREVDSICGYECVHIKHLHYRIGMFYYQKYSKHSDNYRYRKFG